MAANDVRRDKNTAAGQAAIDAAMGDGSEITIDEGSGISADEQREIIADINGIAEKNRRSLSAGAQMPGRRLGASKNGGRFPVMVNALALLALLGGFFALHSFQVGADARAREGTRIFSDIERALIEEIRRETNALLAEKDREISMIVFSLAGIETRLMELDGVGGEPAGERLLAQSQLMAEQGERHAELEKARLERSRILEDARLREAALSAQLEARVREFAASGDMRAGDLAGARAELAELSTEQARAAAAGDQIAGLFARTLAQIAERNFDEAGQTIESLREFLGGPALHALRPMQARGEFYAQSADALESLLGEYRAAHEALLSGSPPSAGPEEDALLTQRIEQLQGELAAARNALTAGDAGAAQAISQYRGEVGRLESAAASLQSANAALASQRDSLQGSLAAQTQAAENLRMEIQSLQTSNAALNQTVSARDSAISALQDENESIGAELAQARQQIQNMMQTLQGLIQQN